MVLLAERSGDHQNKWDSSSGDHDYFFDNPSKTGQSRSRWWTIQQADIAIKKWTDATHRSATLVV